MWETYHERKEKYEKEMEEYENGDRRNRPINPDGGRNIMEDDYEIAPYEIYDDNGNPATKD